MSKDDEEFGNPDGPDGPSDYDMYGDETQEEFWDHEDPDDWRDDTQGDR